MTAIDTDVKQVEKMFSVNVFGPMRMIHIFHPLLIQSKGTVVNIGSVGGIVPYVYGCRPSLQSDPDKNFHGLQFVKPVTTPPRLPCIIGEIHFESR